MFALQICFADAWVTVASGFARRDDAHWALAQWRKDNKCESADSFRVIETVS